MHRVDAAGNSLGVHWELAEGIRSLPGWRKGVRQKKTETCRKIIGDDGQRSSFSIGPGFRRCSGISSKFTRRFAEGIGKLTRNTPGDNRKKTGRLAATIPEPIRLVGVAELPRSTGKLPVLDFSKYV
ncbi:hypothetical protein B296_00040572 [Ensete ventricosum]|uniref:Uncharacterized protein n=1 Tax=Ensete ventricosum TaxID=4639 RepID=A0A426XGK7_ENSVE|nr:hypothetical protein B296_00040572 [Ensete ventricosum]